MACVECCDFCVLNVSRSVDSMWNRVVCGLYDYWLLIYGILISIVSVCFCFLFFFFYLFFFFFFFFSFFFFQAEDGIRDKAT